ncbi:unnamed protein product [Prorocentrum cordatum]|uniref:Tetratricopeptide repeat protein 38 n=1 Tax=Prorocentrum cordatum TaxID=2364126 RepID=A0ABN9PGJ5_9DINO|nr:unnamed protein product [Polarella glacialis]
MMVFRLVQSVVLLTAAADDSVHSHLGHAPLAPPFTDLEAWQPLVGRFAFNITTLSSEAQRLFGIGLLLIYNFDQPNAQSAFKACLENDPSCSMCWWGLAHAHGPFLNRPTKSSDDLAAGLFAAANASAQLAKRRDRHSAKERVLIDAMAVRYPANSAAGDQVKSYKQYAKVLRTARESNVSLSSDVDLTVFDAEARMVLMCDDAGYHFYKSNGDDLPPTPAEGTAEISKMLRGVLATTGQTHPYAQHLLIHSTEMSNSEALGAGSRQQPI